jgi:hypothetical protein
MDDLTALRELRAAVPQPDADRLASARARVVAVTGRRRLIRPARPLLLVMAFGLAAGLTLVLVLVDQMAGGGHRPPREHNLAASAVLEQAALVAERRSTGTSSDAQQWQYRKYLVKQNNGEESIEEWIRYDGKQTATYDDAGRLKIENVKLAPGENRPSPEQFDQRLRALPTDPAMLLAQIRSDRFLIDPTEEGFTEAGDPDAEAFQSISSYLQQKAFMPPKLEAAMYRALAMIPGVGVEEGVDDGTGRKGLGIYKDGLDSADLDPTRSYLILARGTYDYLGRRTVWLRDEWIGSSLAFRAGTVYTAAELGAGLVAEPGQRP